MNWRVVHGPSAAVANSMIRPAAAGSAPVQVNRMSMGEVIVAAKEAPVEATAEQAVSAAPTAAQHSASARFTGVASVIAGRDRPARAGRSPAHLVQNLMLLHVTEIGPCPLAVR